MGNFTLAESEYPKVPEILLSMVQGFADSLEYERLSEIERQLPGVFAAQFTRFFVRLQEAELRGDHDERDTETLAGAYRAIEKLASSRDKQLRSLVQDEIFEDIRASEGTWPKIKVRLGWQSRTLFDQWNKSNP